MLWSTILSDARTIAQDAGTTPGVSSAQALVPANNIGRWLRQLEPPRTVLATGGVIGLNVTAGTMSATTSLTNISKIVRLWNTSTVSTEILNAPLLEMASPDVFFEEIKRHRAANSNTIATTDSPTLCWVHRNTTATGADQGKWVVHVNRLASAGFYLSGEVEQEWAELTGSGSEYPDLLPNSISIFTRLLAYEIARLNNRDQAFLSALIAPFQSDEKVMEYFERERVAKASRSRG